MDQPGAWTIEMHMSRPSVADSGSTIALFASLLLTCCSAGAATVAIGVL
jgi:hypothetical protein